MTGVPFSLDGQGHVLISWMSRRRVYWSISDRDVTRFVPRVPAPDGADLQNYPLVLANQKGEVLLVWKEGSRVRWAGYTRDGRLTGECGSAAAGASHGKPTAFVGSDDRFHVVL